EGPRSWPLRRVLAYLGLCKDVSSRTTSGRQTQHPQSTQPARRRSMSLFYPSLSPECYVAGAVVKLGPLGSDPAKPKRPRQDALIGFVSRERTHRDRVDAIKKQANSGAACKERTFPS